MATAVLVSTRGRDTPPSGGQIGARHDGVNPPLFPGAARWVLLSGAGVVGVVIVAWSSTLADDRDGYVLSHAVATAPFLVVAMVYTWRALRTGPPEHRGVWEAGLAACTTSALATTAAFGAVAWDSDLLLALDVAMLVAGGPLWATATLRMARLLRGRFSMSVDLVDAATALAVLGAPVVLLVAEPLSRARELAFAVPFAVAAVVAPGFVYLALVNLSRVPRGERSAVGIGVALAAASAVNVTLQLARVLGQADLPLPVPVGTHVVTMIALMSVSLWAHQRSPARRAAELPDDGPVRSNPIPYVSAAVLPLVAVSVFASRDDRTWGVPFLVVVVLIVVALNAVRHTALSREAQRLYGGLTRMSEERRRLLADLLRAIEDDRRRTAAELHGQAVALLTTLVTTIQSVYAALPSDTALAVKEAMTQAQDDLAVRVEELRQLMVAMRPPGLQPLAGGGSPADSILASALSAYASELYGDGPTTVRVEVDPALHLEWATMTIAYRIAQEALANAARHADATTVTVRVGEQDGGVLVEVDDDGSGFRPGPAAPGSGLATMELFARLGRGELTVRSTPGSGTQVRCLLGARSEGLSGPRPRRHLRAVPSLPEDT